MSVTPLDFLRLAEGSSSEQEIEVRCAVSRAYYSGYLTAREFQTKIGGKLPLGVKGGVHARLISFYEQHLAGEKLPSNQQIRVSALLRLSKKLRTKADYHLNCDVHASDKCTSVECAKEIQKLLSITD